MKALDNIIEQRVKALQTYLKDPNILDEKLDELQYFVKKKRLEIVR